MTFKIVTLHERLALTDLCCKLLNSEWKRSDGTRLRWLEQSNVDFPCNLVMLENDDNETIVGHARLICVVGDKHALYVSSVIISKARRGSGIGKKLMELIEQYAAGRKFKALHLRTDKPGFYKKCGYETSTPVEQCTGKALQSRILAFQQNQKLIFNSTTGTTKVQKAIGNLEKTNSCNDTCLKSQCSQENIPCSLSIQQCSQATLNSTCPPDLMNLMSLIVVEVQYFG